MPSAFINVTPGKRDWGYVQNLNRKQVLDTIVAINSLAALLYDTQYIYICYMHPSDYG